MKKHLLLIALLGIGSATMWAGPIDRTQLEGLKGDEILQKLHTMIKDHKVLSYDNVRADRAGVDIVSNKVVDMYSSCPFGARDYCGYGTDFERCDCHNREHVLPKAWWGGDKTVPMYTDLHHVIPTDFEANTQRQDYPYGEVSSQTWTNGVSKFGKTTSFSTANVQVFEPADEYKGDIARIYFYMLTCYLDYQLKQDKNVNSKLVFGYSSVKEQSKFTSEALNLFLKWYRNDAVSSKETTRNDKVEAKQDNRNPFVDYPELVEYIWGNKKNVPYSIETDLFEQKIEQAAQRKVVIDGRLYIKAEGALYDIMGNKVANF